MRFFIYYLVILVHLLRGYFKINMWLIHSQYLKLNKYSTVAYGTKFKSCRQSENVSIIWSSHNHIACCLSYFFFSYSISLFSQRIVNIYRNHVFSKLIPSNMRPALSGMISFLPGSNCLWSVNSRVTSLMKLYHTCFFKVLLFMVNITTLTTI